MIIDSGGRVFVLSTDLQPPATRLVAKGNGGDNDTEGGSDAFVAALRNTAQTGPLVQKLLKAVNDEVGKWGDRMVEWQQSVISFLDERETAAETALSMSPTTPQVALGTVGGAHSQDHTTSCSLLPPFVPQSLRYKRTRPDSDKARRGNNDGGVLPASSSSFLSPLSSSSSSSAGVRKALEFIADNQWVLLRDFLISCCDPVCRTEIFNEYRVSSSSLSAAEAEGRYTVSDIRNVIIYFCVISASRSLATGERGPLVGRLPPRHSDSSPSASNNAATEKTGLDHYPTLHEIEDSLYAISPLSAFDSVMYSALSTSLAVSGGSGPAVHPSNTYTSSSSSVSRPFGASSSPQQGGGAVGQHAVTLLQRHVIVGRGGQRAPSSFLSSPTAVIGGGGGTLSGALALTAIFVPRPIEATLHAQGKDGRLKIVLRRKAGLWHQLLAEDEAWEASASKNAHNNNKKNASSSPSSPAVMSSSTTMGHHHHQQTFLSSLASSGGNNSNNHFPSPPSSSALAKQLATALPPPPLRNYLCCSSRVYLEYLVGQMRFLFNPVVLASAKDLASSSVPTGAAGTQPQRQDHHLNNNNSISNFHHRQHSGGGGQLNQSNNEEDADDIDIGDLFGEDDANDHHHHHHHHVQQQQQQRVSGLQRLLALLGGKVAPQLVFSDVEGRTSGEDIAREEFGGGGGGGESARVSGTVLSESALGGAGRSAPQTRSAVHDSAVLTSRLDQLVSCDSLSHQPLLDSSSTCAFPSHVLDDPTVRLRLIKDRLRGAGSAHQLNNPNRSYTPTSLRQQHTAITADAHANSRLTGAGVVYCAEIKPNALRELRAILHDRYGINVDCYFDFMSEEEGSASSAKTAKPSSTGGSDRGEMAVSNFKLKPGVALRPYQKASLERFCQDERKVFQQQDSTADDGEEDGDSDNANPATNNTTTASTAEEIARKAQAEEDAYNASLTITRANTNNRTDPSAAVSPSFSPTRRIAHHGIVVLPCGAGKTLTGIAASAMVGRRTIVMCINVLSVLQWRDQFLKWTCLRPDQVTICTRDLKQIPSDVFITTYSMLTAQQPVNSGNFKRKGDVGVVETENSRLKKRIMEEISNTAWGMLVLDEVHVAPASCFQTVVDKVKYHCVLGLSATLLREDMGIDKLRYLVGPKLYEANWLELTRAGNLAPVMCAEVRCPLPPSMLKQYLMHRGGYAAEARQVMALERGQMRRQKPLIGGEHVASDDEGGDGPTSGSRRIQVDIECINPFKLWCTQALVAFHESRTPPDKTIIFCDSVPAAHYYARKLGIPFMDRSARDTERSNMLKYFTHSKYLNTIILTRVGDIALDLPEATVVIQISGLFASQRQEAQRLGRILRPKPPSLDHGMSFFYSLVSDDTAEVEAAVNRQAWLRDQGYTYRMLKCEEILAHYRMCRQAFVRDALPHAAPSSDSTMNGPIGIASPFSRPLACVGGPVWYFRIPVHVATVRVSVASSSTVVSRSANGGRGVLRLNLKRSREDDTAKEAEETSLAANISPSSRSVTTATRWMWVPFSAQNSLVLERSFVLGHYNRDVKLRLYPVASSSSKGNSTNAFEGPLADLPDHPPLRLASVESVPLPMAIRTVTTPLPDTTDCTCKWEAMGVLQSCQGPVTKPRAGEFGTGDASKCKGGWGRKKLSAATTSSGHQTTDGSKSAAIDGSGGFVYFDTSDVPSSHGEWVVTVMDPSDGGEAPKGSSSSKGGSGSSSVATAKAGIIKLLSCDGATPSVPNTNGVRKGSATAYKTMVLALRIRRGRGPVEVHEPGELFGEGASDDSAKLARLLNEDTASIRVGEGMGSPEVKQEERKLVGSSSVSQGPLTCRSLPTPKAFPLVDLEADHSVEWNSHYAFGDSLDSLGVSTGGENSCGVSGILADEHDCCLPAGGLRRLPCGRPFNVLGLLAKSLSLEYAHLSNMHGEGVEGEDSSHLHSHSCVQHFTHTEVGHRKGK